MILYRFVRPIICLFIKLKYNPLIINSELIPNNEKVILAGNHTNNLDCLLLIASTKREIRFLAKDDLIKGWKGIIFKSMGIIPVNRNIHDSNALKMSEELLCEGNCICIFPEGTINRSNDTILKFKTGAVRMSNHTNTYIIPFTIKGKYKKNKLKLQFYNKIICNEKYTEENDRLMNIISNELIKE